MATANPTAVKTRALPALPKLTDHLPYAEALEKAERIAAKCRPVVAEMLQIESDFAAAVTQERVNQKTSRAAAAAAAIIAGEEPAAGWSLPRPSERLQARYEELKDKLDLLRFAATVFEQDTLEPARREAVEIAQAAVLKDRFGPAVLAMLNSLADFVRRYEIVRQMHADLDAADLTGGPVAMPWFPGYRFGYGDDFAGGLRHYAREIAEAGTVAPGEAARAIGIQ